MKFFIFFTKQFLKSPADHVWISTSHLLATIRILWREIASNVFFFLPTEAAIPKYSILNRVDKTCLFRLSVIKRGWSPFPTIFWMEMTWFSATNFLSIATFD